MNDPAVSQASNTFDQQGQTVHGNQWNVASVHLYGLRQQTWPSAIRPLRTDTIPDARRPQLQNEFYEGGYTRFEHILADLDFRRDEKLAEIAQAFEKQNVVIIHAASGQGKTTLAYRYLYQHYPDDKRYAIERIPSLHHALDLAQALAERVATEPDIIAVHMDVHPQDTDWTELPRQLTRHPNLHLLITVREEDFRRANITGAGFAFEPVDLTFTKQEARLIYERTSSSLPQSNFLSFEEAWAAFGGKGPLLEFVYLLTHTITLRDRLAAQVFALRQEARQEKNRDKLHVLELVAVASGYEARLQTAKLIHTLDLFEPAHTFQLLEQEYLIRRNQEEQTIGGLHAIRSQILVELLTSPDITPWLALAKKLLPILREEDLETFLLHALVEHPTDFSALLQTMTTFQPDTWRGAAGLLRCLLWAGVRTYVDANQAVVEEAHNLMGRAWYFIIHLNFAGQDVPDSRAIWDSLESLIDKEKLDQFIAIQARQTPTTEALHHAATWLSNLAGIAQAPANAADWAGVAELLYWAGRCGQLQILDWISEGELIGTIQELPISICAELSIGLFTMDRAAHARWLTQVRPTLERRLAQEEGILWLEEEADTLKIHFITNYGHEDSLHHQDVAQSTDPIHAITMRRIQLVRNLLPNYDRYGAQGYGHKLQALSLQFDSTEKAGVPKDYLPPPWGVQLNGIAGGLVRNQYRVATWQDCIEQIMEMRQTIVTCLRKLRRGLERYLEERCSVFIYNHYVQDAEWQNGRSLTQAPPELPLVAVDPWGLIAEGQPTSEPLLKNQNYTRLIPNAIALARYQPFLDAQKEYLSALNAFMTQAIHVMIVNGATKKRTAQNDPAIIHTGLKEHGIRTDFDHLSTFNLWQAKQKLFGFQHSFRHLFAHLVASNQLTTLEEDEARLLSHVWQLWYVYAHDPEQVVARPLRTVPQLVLKAREAVEKRVQQALTEVSTGGVAATRLHTELRWEDAATCWILLDVDNPIKLYQSSEALVSALQKALNALQPQDLEYFLLREFCEYTVIVPLVRGRLIGLHVFPLYTLSTLVSAKSIAENLVSFMSRPLPESYTETLGLAQWQSAEITAANQLSVSVATLMFRAGQLAEFQRLPDVTHQGKEVLNVYMYKQAKALSECVQSYLDATTQLLARFQALSEAERLLHEHLVMAVAKVAELHAIVWPWEAEENISLTPDDIVNYAQRLTEIYQEAEAVRLLWIADALEQM